MSNDNTAWSNTRKQFQSGAGAPDLATVPVALLLEPFWQRFFSEDKDDRIIGAEGLIKYRVMLETNKLKVRSKGAKPLDKSEQFDLDRVKRELEGEDDE